MHSIMTFLSYFTALSLSCHKSDTERDCTAPVDVLSVATPEECCLFNGGVTYLQNGSSQCMECIGKLRLYANKITDVE